MTEKEIKRLLEDRGLRVADLAREVEAEFGVTIRSADSMLRELIAGRRWFPVYAAWLKKNHGITVEKPAWLRPVRERMRVAA
jgi:hypothetical protein